MTTNILTLTAADSGKTLPLRGDMGVALNFTPADNHFRVGFITQDAGTFVIGSTTRMFRALNLTAQSSLSVGGKVGLFVEIMYDSDKSEFVVTKTNLVSGDGGTGGTGTTGSAPTIMVAQTVTGAPGTAALVENIGSPTALQLKFTIPRGDTGAAGTGSGGTNFGLPVGGAAGQILGKTGSADYAVGWINPPAGSGGSTGSGSPEITVTPDGSGNVELNAALGDNFRLVLTSNVKVLNPVGYAATEGLIRLKVVQGVGGPWTVAWDTKWAFADGQPPALATDTGAINKIVADLTNGDIWLTDITPTSTVTAGYAGITPIARIANTMYYRMYGTLVIPSNTTAMGAAVNGDIIVVQRNGKGGEVTGTAQDKSITITGALPSGQRALLTLGVTDYLQGQANRPSFNKALLNFEGTGVSEVRDIRLTAVRNSDGDARGIAPNGSHSLTVRNVEVTNCNNGMMWGTGFTGYVHIYDSLFDGNGVGSPDASNSHGTGSSVGYTHNIYAGETDGGVIVERSSFINAVDGHDFKSRAASTTIRQSLFQGATKAREQDYANGGTLLVEDSIIHKTTGSTQGNVICIGGEGIDTTRPREYIYRNVRFQSEYGSAGQDATWMVNKDPTVPVRYIDCEWVGTYTSGVNTTPGDDPFYAGMVTVNGHRHFPGVAPSFETTGGPLGPRSNKPVGYFPVANTPVA